MQVKQVIVMRHDLKMRAGKQIAQGSHASMAWLSNRIRNQMFERDALCDRKNPSKDAFVSFSEAENIWLRGAFTKICVRVESEEELMNIYYKAKEANLTVELITDSGLTEFGGVPTRTCLAIGPNEASEIDKITGELKLL